MKRLNNLYMRLIVAIFIIAFTYGCNSEKQTIITVTVKDKSGNPQPDRKVYEFEYPATHPNGNNPFVANKFRLTNKSGKAVFVLEDYEYDKTKSENTLWFTVFNEVAGDTYTVAGNIEVTFEYGDKISVSLYID